MSAIQFGNCRVEFKWRLERGRSLLSLKARVASREPCLFPETKLLEMKKNRFRRRRWKIRRLLVGRDWKRLKQYFYSFSFKKLPFIGATNAQGTSPGPKAWRSQSHQIHQKHHIILANVIENLDISCLNGYRYKVLQPFQEVTRPNAARLKPNLPEKSEPHWVPILVLLLKCLFLL